MEKINSLLRGLSFADLAQWAGESVSSRARALVGKVEGLERTADNQLTAMVAASEMHSTRVRLGERGPEASFCTCSSEAQPCRHAVALLLAAAGQVRRKGDIPLPAQGEALGVPLSGERRGASSSSPPQEPPAASAGPPEKARKAGRTPAVQKYLSSKSREELLALLVELAGRFPVIEQRILETGQLQSGQIEPLLRSLHQEIRRLSNEPAWYNQWTHEGNLPDYSHVEEQLAALLARGHFDAVLELGEELWSRGVEQVEQADDDGATARAISACMAVVLRALGGSSLTPDRQLLWVIDRLLGDEYSLLDGVDAIFDDPLYAPAHWQEVAVVLEDRLGAREGLRCSVFADTYRRKEVMQRLIQAYRRGGWGERVLPLLEKEADLCQNYEQLVEVLLAEGNREAARQWCIRGFDRTRDTLHGVAAAMQRRLREIAAAEKRFDLVAAYRAQDYFTRPTLESYRELRRASEKAGCWPEVRASVLGYLESGERSDLPGKGRKTAPWPLPQPEVSWPKTAERRGARRFPDRPALIEIAVFEKQFDEAVRLYTELEKSGRMNDQVALVVAKAVVQSHPAIALGIWRRLVDSLISQVRPKAYAEAVGYLRLMHRVYEAENRLADWQALLAELKRVHKAKRRLITLIDGLAEARPVKNTN